MLNDHDSICSLYNQKQKPEKKEKKSMPESQKEKRSMHEVIKREEIDVGIHKDNAKNHRVKLKIKSGDISDLTERSGSELER